MKAALYARYSTDKQREASIEDQFRNCINLVEREGWEIVAKFDDKALSGAKTDRPGYQALLKSAEQKHFDVIVVDEVSRLWRDQEAQWRDAKRLEFWGLDIIGVNDGIDTRSGGYGLLLSIRGAMNEEARREIGKRTHRGLEGQARKCKNAGGRSYGYRHVPEYHPTLKDHLGQSVVTAVHKEIDPGEARVVRQIFQWFADGWSPRQIANELNAKGVPSPGKKWNRKHRQCRGWAASAIYGDMKKGRGILLNRLYIGEYIWNRTKRLVDPDTKQRKNRLRPESEWVVNDMPELRIVDQGLWNRVQGRFEAQREKSEKVRTANKNTGGRTPKYLLSSVLKCGVCGGNFIMSNARDYACGTHKDRGDHVCSNNLKVRRRLVEDKILEGIKRDLLTPDALALFKREIARLMAQKKQPDTQAQRRQLAETEKQIENLLNAIKAGVLTPTTKGELVRLESERDRLLAALKAAPKLTNVTEFLPRAVDGYKELVDNLAEVSLRDVARARAQIKSLLGGEIRLLPHKAGYLEAELAAELGGLIKLASVRKRWCRGEDLNLHGVAPTST